MLKPISLIQSELIAQIPLASQNILVINCGDGQLGPVIKKQLKTKIKIWGYLLQEKHLQAAKYNLDCVVKNVKELNTQIFDCIIWLDIHLFLHEPTLIDTLVRKSFASEGVMLFTFLNAQALDYFSALVTSGHVRPIPWPYNLSLMRFILYQSQLQIQGIFTSTVAEIEQLNAQLPLTHFQEKNLTLSLPARAELFSLFSVYVLLKVRHQQSYNELQFQHTYAPVSKETQHSLKTSYNLPLPLANNLVEMSVSMKETEKEQTFQQLIWQQIVQIATERKFKKILLIDAQDGQLAHQLKQAIPWIEELVGIEAEHKLAQKLVGDFDKVFPSLPALLGANKLNYFDCIITLDIHQQAEEPLQLIESYQTLLQPEGLLLLSFLNFQNILQLKDLLIYGFSSYFYASAELPAAIFNFSYLQHCLASLKLKVLAGLCLVNEDYPENINYPLDLNLAQYGSIKVNCLPELMTHLALYCFLVTSSQNILSQSPSFTLVKESFEHLRSVLYQNQFRRFWSQSGKSYLLREREELHPEGSKYQEAKFFTFRLSTKKPTSLLEIGCGYGRNLKLLRKLLPTAKLVGVDISRIQLEEAKGYLDGETIDLIHYDGHSELPFSLASFDLVFTSGVLCVLPPTKLQFLCEESLRVAKYHVVHNEDSKLRDLRYYQHNLGQLYQSSLGYKCQIEPNPYAPDYFIYWIDKFKFI